MGVQERRDADRAGRELTARLGWWGVCALLVLMAYARGATTRPATAPSSDELAGLVAQLGDGDAAVREAASVRLMGLKRGALPSLREVVRAKRPLSAGQWAALREIVCHVWLTGEPYQSDGRRGFLGVKDINDLAAPEMQLPPEAGPEAGSAGVIVSERIPGFCGFHYLRTGDVILAAWEGAELVPLRSPRDLQQWVGVRHRGGDEVTLRVLRRGSEIEMTFRLDPFPVFARQEIPDPLAVERFRVAREKAAGAYWTAEFEPLSGR